MHTARNATISYLKKSNRHSFHSGLQPTTYILAAKDPSQRLSFKQYWLCTEWFKVSCKSLKDRQQLQTDYTWSVSQKYRLSFWVCACNLQEKWNIGHSWECRIFQSKSILCSTTRKGKSSIWTCIIVAQPGHILRSLQSLSARSKNSKAYFKAQWISNWAGVLWLLKWLAEALEDHAKHVGDPAPSPRSPSPQIFYNIQVCSTVQCACVSHHSMHNSIVSLCPLRQSEPGFQFADYSSLHHGGRWKAESSEGNRRKQSLWRQEDWKLENSARCWREKASDCWAGVSISFNINLFKYSVKTY